VIMGDPGPAGGRSGRSAGGFRCPRACLARVPGAEDVSFRAAVGPTGTSRARTGTACLVGLRAAGPHRRSPSAHRAVGRTGAVAGAVSSAK